MKVRVENSDVLVIADDGGSDSSIAGTSIMSYDAPLERSSVYMTLQF